MRGREELLKEYSAAAAFADAHIEDNPDRLLLNAAKWPGFDMKTVASTIESRRRLVSKAPLWASTPGLVFPRPVSAQQCSSEASAAFKASLAASFNPSSITDITGGIGVDCLAFSNVCRHCHYNEMEFELAVAAEHNYKVISEYNKNVHSDNISVTNYFASPDNAEFVRWLDGLSTDMIYLDPARRDARGNKVFLLEDCSPDVVALQDILLSAAPTVLVKLSTMADITMVQSRLRHCSRILIVEYGGDCREMLVVLRRDFRDECVIGAVNLDLGNEPLLVCRREDFALSPSIAPASELTAGNYVFEPSKSLMKTGSYGLMSRILGAGCVARDSHFFILTPERLASLGNLPLLRSGRLSRILETAVLSGSSIREFSRKYPCAETVARNVRFTSEELRSRMGCRPSESIRIFALGADSIRDRILIAAQIQ